MFAVSMHVKGNRGDPSTAWNLDAMDDTGTPYFREESLQPAVGEQLFVVEDFPDCPTDPNPNLCYLPWYDVVNRVWQFDSAVKPKSVEEQLAALSAQQTQTELALAELAGILAGGAV